jgi:hypothetical protein
MATSNVWSSARWAMGLALASMTFAAWGGCGGSETGGTGPTSASSGNGGNGTTGTTSTGGCPGTLLECNGVCADTQVDPANCGGCGNPCEAGEVCSAGTCASS